MNILVALEHRFVEHNGAIYDRTVYGRAFWEPYVQSFGGISVLARARSVDRVEPTWSHVDTDGVRFIKVPDYNRSLRSYLKLPAVASVIWRAVKSHDGLVVRAPCNIGYIAWIAAIANRNPYAIELIGDLWDASVCNKAPVKFIRRRLLVPLVQNQCKKADVASYVTHSYLQQRYPSGEATRSYVWSDNLINVDDIRREPRLYCNGTPLRVIYTASLAPYKGHTYLLDAVAQAVTHGADIRLTLVGDGPLLSHLREYAQQQGNEGRVEFAGSLPNSQVLERLDGSDVYVTTSLTEGLPRAVVEALAKALPVIGFDVGGIPEMVPKNCLVPVGDVDRLSKILLHLNGNREELSRLSASSRMTAFRYTVDVQYSERLASYEALMNAQIITNEHAKS